MTDIGSDLTDLEQAKKILADGEYTCVLCKSSPENGDAGKAADTVCTVMTSRDRGVAPLVKWLSGGTDISGFSAADRVVGKAAALLFLPGGVKAVYVEVMDEQAQRILSARGVDVSFGRKVPRILNRTGTGTCPMEEAVAQINDPAAALPAIRKKIGELHSKP